MPEAAVPVYWTESPSLHPVLSVQSDGFHPKIVVASHAVVVSLARNLRWLSASAPPRILRFNLLPAAADGGSVPN